jgi:hypothetical protein
MKIFNAILFCFFSMSLWSQQIPAELVPEFTDCEVCYKENQTSQQQVSYSGTCPIVSNDGRLYDSKFMPTSTQSIINVRVNFIFLQREDGTGNFQEDNPEDQALINDFITEMNTTYSNMSNPNSLSCYTGTDFISDARIRFVVNRVYIRDNYGWNNRHDDRTRSMCPDYSNWYLNYLDNQIVSNPNISRGINVYFTEDSINYRNYVELQNTTSYNGVPYACSQFPSLTNFLQTSKLHMPDTYSKYWHMKNKVPAQYHYTSWIPEVRSWEVSGVGRNLAHELGHSLWLYHTSPYYNSGGCLYSIMNPSGSSPRNYLPPPEIGRMHAALSLTNLRTFVPSDTYTGVKQISTIEAWNNIRLYQSLDITSSGQMTFQCDVTMPSQSYINVSGMLTIANSTIHSIQNDWGGIVVKSGGLLVLNSTTVSDYNITVESGGTIQIKGSLSVTGNHNINVLGGGYICIENGTSIQLSDYNSLIKINEGALNGVNPTLAIQSNCVSSPTTISITGSGLIIDYGQDIYIQNENINTNRFIGGKNIFIGNHVTTSKTQGDVIINNGANVVFDGKTVTFDNGFECTSGSTFEQKNH